MCTEQGVGGDIKRQNLLKAKNDSDLWKAVIVYDLKGGVT